MSRRSTKGILLSIFILTLLFCAGFVIIRKGTSVSTAQAQAVVSVPTKHKHKRTHGRKAKCKCKCEDH